MLNEQMHTMGLTIQPNCRLFFLFHCIFFVDFFEKDKVTPIHFLSVSSHAIMENKSQSDYTLNHGEIKTHHSGKLVQFFLDLNLESELMFLWIAVINGSNNPAFSKNNLI